MPESVENTAVETAPVNTTTEGLPSDAHFEAALAAALKAAPLTDEEPAPEPAKDPEAPAPEPEPEPEAAKAKEPEA